MEPLLTVNDVLSALAVSRATLYRLVAAGELPLLKLGRATRFRTEDVRAYVDRRLEAGPDGEPMRRSTP